ncbi:hypothetical protein ACQKWADRAFT_40588 [Trichoderma austrokoningii]
MPCTVPVERPQYPPQILYGLPKRQSASSLSGRENCGSSSRKPGLLSLDQQSRQPRLQVSSTMKNKDRKNKSQSVLDRMPVSMALEHMPRHVTSIREPTTIRLPWSSSAHVPRHKYEVEVRCSLSRPCFIQPRWPSSSFSSRRLDSGYGFFNL